MHVIEQSVDCDVPSKSVNERGTERLAGKGNQWTGWRWVLEDVAYDLVRDPAVLGVFFCPEVHKIQLNTPKFHLGCLKVLGLVWIGFHGYRISDELVSVGLEIFGQAVCERCAGYILKRDVDIIALNT